MNKPPPLPRKTKPALLLKLFRHVRAGDVRAGERVMRKGRLTKLCLGKDFN